MEKSFSGRYKTGHSDVIVRVSVIFFEDSGSIVSYCPALNVYGYGSDEAEAKKSFEISLGEFFRYTINKGTLESELRKLGWTISNSRRMSPPSFSDLLRNNEDFSEIFNHHDFKKEDRDITIPTAA